MSYKFVSSCSLFRHKMGNWLIISIPKRSWVCKNHDNLSWVLKRKSTCCSKMSNSHNTVQTVQNCLLSKLPKTSIFTTQNNPMCAHNCDSWLESTFNFCHARRQLNGSSTLIVARQHDMTYLTNIHTDNSFCTNYRSVQQYIAHHTSFHLLSSDQTLKLA